MPSSSSPPLFLQNFLYKAIGVSLAACANKDLVRKQLQELLETARYQEEAEREVGPELVGRRGAAASHLASWPTVCSSSPRGGRERGSQGARDPSGLKEQGWVVWKGLQPWPIQDLWTQNSSANHEERRNPGGGSPQVFKVPEIGEGRALAKRGLRWRRPALH